ncbi:MAG: hypothetical protein ACOX86_07745 [Pelotomaculaceae bacterium]
MCPGRFGQPENPARQQVAESRRVGREVREAWSKPCYYRKEQG